jgi:hypothetical protein
MAPKNVSKIFMEAGMRINYFTTVSFVSQYYITTIREYPYALSENYFDISAGI